MNFLTNVILRHRRPWQLSRVASIILGRRGEFFYTYGAFLGMAWDKGNCIAWSDLGFWFLDIIFG
jgi:hypothetical protein